MRSGKLETNTCPPDSIFSGSNFFDDKTIIIDEIHNVVRNIVGNSIIGLAIYYLIMSAKNIRFVGLSGTPLVNYPTEIAVMLNMAYGWRTVYNIQRALNDAQIIAVKNALKTHELIDYYYVSNKGVIVTMNPPMFANVFERNDETDGISTLLGIRLDTTIPERIEGYPESFIDTVIDIIRESAGIPTLNRSQLSITCETLLPEGESFLADFVDSRTNRLKPEHHFLLAKRIVGLVSFFPGISGKMPRIVPNGEI